MKTITVLFIAYILGGSDITCNSSQDDTIFKLPNVTDSGPLPDIMARYPNLTVVGSFNNRFFFIDHSIDSQYQARFMCTEYGMKLADFHSQQELEFISDATLPPYENIWTDGGLNYNIRSFYWQAPNEYIGNLIVDYRSAIEVGFAVNRVSTNIRLALYPHQYYYPYYCVLDRNTRDE